LDATLESLIEVGYARTTTSRVCELAGLSRGAQVHHFPTKAELVAASLERLGERRVQDLERRANRIPDREDRLASALEVLWSNFASSLFLAGLELGVASRSHAEILEVAKIVDPMLDEAFVALIPEDAPNRSLLEDVVRLTVPLLRGMALQRNLKTDKEARRLFELWTRIVAAIARDPATVALSSEEQPTLATVGLGE
jgi:AcrR family transcriptional regulator